VATASARFITLFTADAGVRLDPALDADAQSAVAGLRETGLAPVADIFSGAEIDEIRAYLADKLVTFEVDGPGTGMREGLAEHVPRNVPLAHYKTEDLCRCPLVYKVVHDERLLNLVGAYLGAPPSVATIATWWSFPDLTRPDKSQNFHHDRDDFSIAKLFVYLTDVTPATGPHAFLLRTHAAALLDPLTQNLDRKSKGIFWAWMNKQTKRDEEILQVFGANGPKILLGPRGTSFLEDTRGLHRAVYPRTGARLAFEVTYTVLPKYNEVHTRTSRRDLPFPAARNDISPLTQYATRLLYY
jgi:hypothetical protein